MADLSAYHLWVNNPDFRLLPEKVEQPDTTWCAEGQRFLEWGQMLVTTLADNPSDGAIGWAKAALLDNYTERVRGADAAHRPDTNRGNHQCLHEALFIICDKIRYIKVQRSVPELQVPYQVVQTPAHRVIDAETDEVEPEPFEEMPGILDPLDRLP